MQIGELKPWINYWIILVRKAVGAGETTAPLVSFVLGKFHKIWAK